MRKGALVALLILLALVAFLAGSWHGRRANPGAGPAAGRKILYYVDPMHPAYRSDKPGIAPDCGMSLEPVYADGGAAPAGASGSAPPAGTVRITPDRRQVTGVRVEPVARAAGVRTLRVLGRVAPDETRAYRLNATVDGWVRKVHGNSTGSIVRKDEVLAEYYAPDFLSAEQAYIYALNALDRFRASGTETEGQLEVTQINVRQARRSLANLGMGERQIAEIARTRTIDEIIRITSSADGIVLARNISDGERFEKGKEFYRIADLGRVWILADVPEEESRRLRPGMDVTARRPHTSEAVAARVGKVPPQFDPATRTLKVRLEADNPGYLLRPDMFVDVELPIRYSPAITVPVDAVLDSGTRKTVFIDRGDGAFEPRAVETGWRMGDRVEIVKGLADGERIAVSGVFLLDSESRMKMAAAGIYGAWSVDRVCGMEVDEGKAKAAGRTADFAGETYFFCCDDCVAKFRKDPAGYATPPGRPTAARKESAPARAARGEGTMRVVPAAATHGEATKRAVPVPAAREEPKMGAAAAPGGVSGGPASGMAAAAPVPVDPVCGMQVDGAEARAAGRVSERMGTTYFFCADGCKRAFDADPAKYLAAPRQGGMGTMPAGHGGHGQDAAGGPR